MHFRLVMKRVLAGVAGVAGGGAVVALWMASSNNNHHLVAAGKSEEIAKKMQTTHLPRRSDQLQALTEQTFDVLIIGGGATGCGVALDAVSRGLSTALVEKYDFASGTSSRSTKLIHGGVRYLQKAILGLDVEQYKMVKEALSERANLIEIAPHLAYPLPIMLPVYNVRSNAQRQEICKEIQPFYQFPRKKTNEIASNVHKWWQLPYYYAGIKCYDLVSGRQILKSSYVLSKTKALELFPMLKPDKLVGALVYYDGQQDDARMCLSLALTAAKLGAAVANYTEVVELLKDGVDKNGKATVSGARLRDRMTGKEIVVRAKCVVNATGPFTDFIRQLDSPESKKICQPSSGVHIVLPDYYSPANMGLLDPNTSDGRVIFFLPWQNATMAGTTDNDCPITHSPTPTEEEVSFILNEVRNYLSPDVNVRRGDVLSAWSGIRPLVTNPNSKDTQSIARNHIIEVSDNNLITIAGGKWTTYRLMAEETVDKCIEVCGLKAGQSVTRGLLLDGAHGWTPTMFIRLIQDFGLDSQVAQHLSSSYGTKAFKVAKLAQLTGKRWPVVGKRLHEDYPFIEAEVIYACREYACTAVDVLARRIRLAFINVHAAEEALPKVIEIMARELKWSEERQKEEHENAIKFLAVEMGLHLKGTTPAKRTSIDFSDEEIYTYMKRFQALDSDGKGHITINDLRKYFKKSGERVSEDQLHEILSEVDVNKNAEVDFDEFLQMMKALKTGAVSSSRFALAAERSEALAVKSAVYRSNGGL